MSLKELVNEFLQIGLTVKVKTKQEKQGEEYFTTSYLGTEGNLALFNKGICYFNTIEDTWLYKPFFDETFYRVPFYLLSFNLDKDSKGYYTEATYNGKNLLLTGKTGKAYIKDNGFEFHTTIFKNNKPKTEAFRVPVTSLEF